MSDLHGRTVVRSRWARVTAATVAAGLAVGTTVTFSGAADAAAPVQAQAVGRFLDGAAGGMPLQSLVDLQDARAKAAPNTEKRNPLDAKLFEKGDVPIGDGLKLPGGGVFKLGAANQIAVAHTDGYSYGASGAVSNTGGAELTDQSGDFPGDATINLSGAALGNVSIPGLPSSIPGLPTGSTGSTTAPALGGVVGKIGAVQALAQTRSGGKVVAPQSSIGNVQLAIGSPALAALLSQLNAAFDANVLQALEGSNAQLGAALKALTGSQSSCALTKPDSLAATQSFEDGAVVLDPSGAQITVDVGKLLKRLLGIDISHLSTSNFDLTKFLAQNLPGILSSGLSDLVTGVTSQLIKDFGNCETAFDSALSATPLGAALPKDALSGAFSSLQTQLVGAVKTLGTQFGSAGSAGLAQLADGLTGVADIGLNVQSGPNIQPHDTKYTYTTQLNKTPDQATSVIKGQSLVRAIEIDLLDASGAGSGSGLPSGLPSLPGTSAANARQLAGAHQAAAAAGSSAVTLALGNAAVGPNTAAPTDSTSSNSNGTNPSSTNIPTGVPAGAAGHNDGGSTPLLPIAVALLVLVAAGGGALRFRTRGKFSR